jgi:hypothetical protein
MKDIKVLNLERTVVANRTHENLVEGEKYQLERLNVGMTKTYLVINGEEYNSILFSEDDTELMKALDKVKSENKIRIIARFSEPRDLTLLLGASGDRVFISAEQMREMPIEGVISVGRSEGATLSHNVYGEEKFRFSREVSRMHAILYRENEKSFRVIDVSTFGTEILL